MSILQKIVSQRLLDVEVAKQLHPLQDILKHIETSFPVLDFKRRISSDDGKVSVMAEVKRASPSKGDIAPGIDAAHQGFLYAQAGASAISCLTEPTWFKGTLEDMKAIRNAIHSLPNRPALLRKDFIVDEYQIYESRAYGADSLLLIVATLSDEQLRLYLQRARDLQMEPLVEVANENEMQRAINAGAQVIGINNRDLNTFKVDMNTTNRKFGLVRNYICGFEWYHRKSGCGTLSTGRGEVCLGESLMRSSSAINKILELQGLPITLVKICGIKTVEVAIATAEAGADFIGLVFAESSRKVTINQAKAISSALGKRTIPKYTKNQEDQENISSWYTECSDVISKTIGVVRPLVVGVFANNSLDYISEIIREVGIDVVQLSGKEDPELGKEIISLGIPVWKALHVSNDQDPKEIIELFGVWAASCTSILLDTQDDSKRGVALMGGTGKTFDWRIAEKISRENHLPFILAGGLSSVNVNEAVSRVNPWAVDVSSGVESSPGTKDLKKIQTFISNAKQK
eukprot:TRINITY_DN9884_c0_g1_i6.p1 TRINITY_DN9884_c0_g1~~TRINITY_DN9884_c0_g1_i6.p1  ORF type:complete len:516 (+),score=104.06 TRINITY_DN9884_c0_g1_i6:102-1649(+)